MQARVDWVLIIFGTQVIKKKRPVRPVFPDYLSVSYDYGSTTVNLFYCRDLSQYGLKKLFKSVSLWKRHLKFSAVTSTKDTHQIPKSQISVSESSMIMHSWLYYISPNKLVK